METNAQKEVVYFLEDLVGKRFNLETLNEVLSKKFEEEIKCEIVNENDEDGTPDWNIMFNVEREDIYGYFDIYILKMRKPGFDGSTFYVTEIGFEFQ